MTEVEGRTERIKITLPLPADERARIGSALEAIRAAENRKDAAQLSWSKYYRATDAACDALGEAYDAAWGEYSRARDAALSECGSVLASWIEQEFGEEYAECAELVLGWLSGGRDLADIEMRAKDHGWCEEWDAARDRAVERFDLS
jgi:hypothetical protein